MEDMSLMFSQATSFNHDISSWDVSNVTDMSNMFSGAISFNQDISSWNVGNVNDMNQMFFGATSFNQNISTWDVVNVRYMNQIFSNANAFNQDLYNWNVMNTTECLSFNQNTPKWTKSKPRFDKCKIDPFNDEEIYHDKNGITIKATDSAKIGTYYLCLLYTSPSPRD